MTHAGVSGLSYFKVNAATPSDFLLNELIFYRSESATQTVELAHPARERDLPEALVEAER